jgi:hypothetical protein
MSKAIKEIGEIKNVNQKKTWLRLRGQHLREMKQRPKLAAFSATGGRDESEVDVHGLSGR